MKDTARRGKRLHLRFTLLIATLLTGHFGRAYATVRSDSTTQPHFILILADDLGYGDVGYQGAPDVETPNLDRFASEGITFTQMRANCTVCSPTRAAILTGRYADRVGVPGVIRTRPQDSWGYLAENVPTLADRLGDAGYHTAIVGKWHLGLAQPNTPNERGFEHFHGFLGDMMDDYYTHRRGGKNFMRKNAETIDPPGHATDLFTDWAIEYLNDRKESDQPFFLYLAYNAPHFPIQPPDEWYQRTKKKFPDMPEKRAKNVALIEHLDGSLGKLFSAIDQMGLRDSTMVAFTSDNGGSLPHAQRNLPWRDGKQSHYDGGLKVPFLIRSPNSKLAGTKSDYAGMIFDLAATFLQRSGVKHDGDSDAVSLVPILEGRQLSTPDRELYFVRREGNNRYVGGAYHAVIRGKWKLLQNDPFSPLELYDLEADPQETTDRVKKMPRIANELKSVLRKHIQRGGRVPWQPPY
ncbi:MAG: sulfatase-like hydrolase/transferase [Planctomycetota bacterium]